MSLSHLFTLSEVTVEGARYGWVNTKIDVVPGMPLEIQGSGSIDFCNPFGANINHDILTPDGDPRRAGGETSLGWGSRAPCRHGQLVARIGNSHVFPIGTMRRIRAEHAGPLLVGHNDTNKVDDNSGEFEVRVCIPVDAVRGQRTPNNGFQLSFEGPGGINGGAFVNLPTWLNKPNFKFKVHGAPGHGQNIERGLFCLPIKADFPIIRHLPGLKDGICLHIEG